MELLHHFKHICVGIKCFPGYTPILSHNNMYNKFYYKRKLTSVVNMMLSTRFIMHVYINNVFSRSKCIVIICDNNDY